MRPKKLEGSTVQVKTICGYLYITININTGGKIEEVFCRMGKAGGCEGAFNEALGRMTVLAIRHGAPIRDIVEQLIEMKCGKPYICGDTKTLSCIDGLAQELKAYMETI